MKSSSVQLELIHITQKLTGYKTVTGNHSQADKCLSFIESYLKDAAGLHFDRIVKNGFHSLLISTQSDYKKSFDLILHGHIDVVPAEGEQFVPKVVGNRIYARGAADMKGGVAALLTFMKYDAIASGKNILLVLTSDEEIGGINGTGYILKAKSIKGSFFISAEGERDWLIKSKQKGVVMAKITANGVGEHSSYTWKGKNAILELIDIYKDVESLFPHKSDSANWYTTINMGKIQGGTAINSIPDTAEALIDIRFCSPWKTPEEVYKKVESVVEKHKGKIKQIMTAHPMNTDDKDSSVRKLNKIAQTVLNTSRSLFFKNHGTNDARYAAELNIPAVAFGPIGKNYHAKKEYVDTTSIETFYTILKKFIE